MNSNDPLKNPEPMEDLGGPAGYYMIYALTAAGVIFFSPFAVRPVAARGATRSSKIQWEARQVEIQQAVSATQQGKGTHEP